MTARRTARAAATVGAVLVLLTLVVAGCGGGSGRAPATTPVARPACTDVELVFARGTSEPPGLGIVGAKLLLDLREGLPRTTVGAWAVPYAASIDQSSAGPGATLLTRRLRSRAATCPSTRFVLGGYSQGASVVDIAVGLTTALGRGGVVPRALAPRVAALVAFGNPSRRVGRRLDRGSGPYAAKALDDCNRGDPICLGGSDLAAHVAYRTDDSVAAAVRFVRRRLR